MSPHWYITGCCHAGLASLAGEAGSGVPAAESKAEADHAKSSLQMAVDAGYRIAAVFRMDSALDPLRRREDFQKLIEELEKPPPAGPEKTP